MTDVATLPETSVIGWCPKSAGREGRAAPPPKPVREVGEKWRGGETREKRWQETLEEGAKEDWRTEAEARSNWSREVRIGGGGDGGGPGGGACPPR